MPTLELVHQHLQANQPVEQDPAAADMLAAVALILHEPPGQPLELLFIERAHWEGDPWSGQMAFPGGRLEPDDAGLHDTALREAFEEVGVELGESIGGLDHLIGGERQDRKLLVAPYVFALSSRPELRTNAEVASTIWIPLRSILRSDAATHYRFEHERFQGSYPAFQYAGHTVWGLTYRITGNFLRVLGHSLPSHEGRERGNE